MKIVFQPRFRRCCMDLDLDLVLDLDLDNPIRIMLFRV